MEQEQGGDEKSDTAADETHGFPYEKLLKQCHHRTCIPEVVPAARRRMGPFREKTRRRGLPGTATKLKVTQEKG